MPNIVTSDVPAGTIKSYGGSTIPSGYLLCDGSAISRTAYAALFSAIGTLYGVGDGSTTFNLPNGQGVFLRGAGSQTISTINYTATLGATLGDQVQGHAHQYANTTSKFAAGSGFSGSFWPPMVTSPDGAGATGGINPSTGAANFTDGTNGTPRTGTETRPAHITINFIIKT